MPKKKTDSRVPLWSKAKVMHRLAQAIEAGHDYQFKVIIRHRMDGPRYIIAMKINGQAAYYGTTTGEPRVKFYKSVQTALVAIESILALKNRMLTGITCEYSVKVPIRNVVPLTP